MAQTAATILALKEEALAAYNKSAEAFGRNPSPMNWRLLGLAMLAHQQARSVSSRTMARRALDTMEVDWLVGETAEDLIEQYPDLSSGHGLVDHNKEG